MRAQSLLALALVMALGGAPAGADGDALTPAQIAAACGIPPILELPRVGGLRVIGSQAPEARTLYSHRDLLYDNGGLQAGLQLGQRYFLRRSVTNGSRVPVRPRGVHTTGWIRIVAVNDTTSIASVDFGCGEIMRDDYLDPFLEPVVPDGADRVDTTGKPDFNVLGRVLFGQDEIITGAIGDFMLIDRGIEQDVAPGSRLAIYRDLKSGEPLAAIGEAMVIAVGSTSAQIRVTAATDSVETGDFVFPRKP